jgi:hypothetical protein
LRCLAAISGDAPLSALVLDGLRAPGAQRVLDEALQRVAPVLDVGLQRAGLALGVAPGPDVRLPHAERGPRVAPQGAAPVAAGPLAAEPDEPAAA